MTNWLQRPALNRILALALLMVAFWLIIASIIEPILSFVEGQRSEFARSTHQLAKLQAFVDEQPAMQTLLDRIKTHPLWSKVYRDVSINAAQSTLQKDLRDITDSQKMKLESVQPMDPTMMGKFSQIGARIGISTTVDQLSHLLLAIEVAPRLLRVENLSVTAPVVQQDGQNPTLVVRADVVGYWLATAPP